MFSFTKVSFFQNFPLCRRKKWENMLKKGKLSLCILGIINSSSKM